MGPIVAGIQAAFAAFAATEVGAFLTTTIVGRLLVSVGASLLMRALKGNPSGHVSQQKFGIVTQVTQQGGTNPLSFCIGKTATDGAWVCPPMTQGDPGGAPNAYLTYVIELGCIPGDQILQAIINGEYVTFSGTADPDYGTPATGKYAGYCWLKFYDGSQTAADAMLLAKFGSYPDRPWKADMIGRDLCYAVITFKINRSLWNGDPTCRFVMQGIPLYDPRLDSTVGGAGSQLWSDRSTWTPSNNAFVQAYNLARGITIPGIGKVYGGGYGAADLPLDNWFAAMNEADLAVNNGNGGTEVQYQTGYEVLVDKAPIDVIAELLKGSAGKMAEIGGTLKVHCGGPALPAYFITDDDIIVSAPEDYSPFPNLKSSYNGVSATYPEPSAQWEASEAPALYNATYEAQDQGQQLVAPLNFQAVSVASQVQRLMQAYLAEERRFRRHSITLPPEAMVLEPFDSIGWTSSYNGYTAKVFEISEIRDDPHNCLQTLSLQERDSSDFDYSSFIATLPTAVSGSTEIPAAQVLASWAVVGATKTDALGLRDLSGIKVSWANPGSDDVQAILIEVEDAGGTLVSSSRYDNVANGFTVITDGIIGGNSYSARGKVVPYSGRATTWSSWLPATAPTVAYPATAPAANFWDSVTALESAAATGGILAVSALTDVTTPVADQMVLKLPEILLYQWDATASQWNAVSSTIATGQVIASMIAAGAVTADKVSVGALNALSAVINGALTINGSSGAFLFGKASATDFSTDGAFMGQTLNADATTTFGMLMGRTSASGTLQYLQITKDAGLNLVNANFSKLLPSSTSNVTVSTSQTVALPVGTQTISLMVLGGGGAGGPSGGAGGASVVHLYDGSTDTGASWTSAGGAGGGSLYNYGQSSPYGTGGASAGSRTNPAHDSPPIAYNATAATGYGAGGGAGSDGFDSNGYMIVDAGGAAAVPVGVSNYDVSALANPTLVITVGGKGIHTNSYAADGSQGLVKYSTFSSALVPVAPVPPRPTATGSFSNTASAFPDLGAGIWVLSNFNNGQGLSMGVGVNGGSSQTRIWEDSSGIVISDTTPTIVSYGTAETIDFQFYSMSQAT